MLTQPCAVTAERLSASAGLSVLPLDIVPFGALSVVVMDARFDRVPGGCFSHCFLQCDLVDTQPKKAELGRGSTLTSADDIARLCLAYELFSHRKVSLSQAPYGEPYNRRDAVDVTCLTDLSPLGDCHSFSGPRSHGGVE